MLYNIYHIVTILSLYEVTTIVTTNNIANRFHITLHSTYTAIKQNTKNFTYVVYYGNGLFNFGSYGNLPTLFAYVLGFDVPTSSIFIESVYMYTSVENNEWCSRLVLKPL